MSFHLNAEYDPLGTSVTKTEVNQKETSDVTLAHIQNIRITCEMRFTEKGPSIPLHLMEQQALGNVIFFCGAGVSVPAGLDTFWTLTDRVVRELDSDRARRALEGKANLDLISRLFEGQFSSKQKRKILDLLDSDRGRAAIGSSVEFDRVFALLAKEFGRDEINRQLFAALDLKRARTLAHHRDILRLSRSASGNTQVVTTNFDLLFERADKTTKPIVPPSLPRLDLNDPIDGVVYLHGRLADTSSGEKARYVISSPDFGRAYLAEGWATRFVKELRERHTLVFLGYSADDPPMRYLLEGLNDREGVVYDNPIYAFAADQDGEAVEAWIDKGVKAIPYRPENRHEALWSTIRLWAEAASDTEKWESEIIDLARKGPRNLEPHERGMVTEFVTTKRGAKVFSEADPSLPSEWLCVFDPYVRFGKPRKEGYEDGAKEIDPLDVYRIDTDLPRPPSSSNQMFDEGTLNPLSFGENEEPSDDRPRLYGAHPLFHNRLSQRLHSLSVWISDVCHEPAAIWWASGAGNSLDRHILWMIGNRARGGRRPAMPEPAAKFWSLFVETAEARSIADREYPWHDLTALINSRGWVPATFRFLNEVAKPIVKASRPLLGSPLPPTEEWNELDLRQLCRLEVHALDRHGTNIDIPDEHLERILAILSNTFSQMLELMDEIGDQFWRAPNLHPSGEAGERYHGKRENLVLWFTELFQKLVGYDKAAALKCMKAWPTNEVRIFAKMRVWAATLDNFLSDQEAFDELILLDEGAFWHEYGQRGILSLMKMRWGHFDQEQRTTLEAAIISGPPRWENEEDDDFEKRRARRISSRLRWLELNSCEISESAQQSLAEFKVVDERWGDEYAQSADESFSPRGGWIAEDRDTRGLEALPLAEILEGAATKTEERIADLTHFRPFKGLVEHYPFKALSALRLALRAGEFPVQFWIDLLSNWPDETSMRLRWLAAQTLASLDDEDALELRYYSSDWLKKHMSALYKSSRPRALAVFDGFLRPFIKTGASNTASSIGDTTIGGEVQPESQVSINKAINSPIGHLTEALWSVTANKGKPLGRLNGNLAERFEQLSQVPGDGGGHAIAILSMHLGWIDFRYRDWSRAFLLPKFKLEDPLSEGAWHGFLYNQNWPTREVLAILRNDWLTILRGDAPWAMGTEGQRFLIDAMVWMTDPDRDGGPLFSFDEVREILRETNSQGRSHAIWTLGNVFSESGRWESFVRPFIENAWPKELRFKSREATRSFLRIAENAGEHFPEVVRTIKPLLRPVQDGDMFTYRIYHDPKKNEDGESHFASEYPHETLVLLNAITGDDRVILPYGFGDALKALISFEPTLQETPEYRRLSKLLD